MSDYITDGDIRDTVITALMTSGMSTDVYHSLTNGAMVDLAESKDCPIASVKIGIDMDNAVREYLVSYFCARVAEDHVGNAMPEGGIELDKYYQKARMFNSRCEQLRQQITYKVLTGQATMARDHVSGGVIWLG